MLAHWGNTIITALLVLTAVAVALEFYGGPKQKKRIKAVLEGWWLRLEEISVPNVGRREAIFTLTVLDNVFGRRAFSKRRLISTAILATSISATMGVLSQILMTPTPPDFARMLGLASLITVGLFLPTFLSAWASVSLTCWIVARSLTLIQPGRGGSLAFVALFVVSIIISFAFVPLFMALQLAPLIALMMAAGSVTGVYPEWGWDGIQIVFSDVLEYFRAPTTNIFRKMVGNEEFVLLLHLPALLRAALAGAFLIWLLVGWALLGIKLTIYRLAETEKGVLSIFGGVLTTAAALVKLWVTH